MEKDYKIRKARIEDIEQIIFIWNQMMEFHAGLDSLFRRCEGAEEIFGEYIQKSISDVHKVVAVAECDGRVVGYCQGVLEKHPPALEQTDYGYIMDAAVDAEHQRRGAGEAMVQYVCRWFKENGISRVEVRFHVKNEISSGFWPKMGFKVYAKTGFMAL